MCVKSYSMKFETKFPRKFDKSQTRQIRLTYKHLSYYQRLPRFDVSPWFDRHLLFAIADGLFNITNLLRICYNCGK